MSDPPPTERQADDRPSREMLDDDAQARLRAWASTLLLGVAIALAWFEPEPVWAAFGRIVPLVALHAVLVWGLLWVRVDPGWPLVLRRFTGIGADIVLCTVALAKVGPGAALVWPVLLWIICGNGLRFGTAYLYGVAAVVLAVTAVLHLVPSYWQVNWGLTLSLQGGIALVPVAYGAVIRQVHHSHATLLDAARHSREMAAAKTQFLANMSHELRTPMNGVLGVADVLAERVTDPDTAELVAMLRRSGASMVRVVDDILTMSKLEAGRVDFEVRDHDLCALARDVATLLQPLADDKDLALEVTLPDQPLWVRCDDTRVRQVLGNLLGNAIKFTETGMVRLRLLVEDSDPGTMSVRIDVEDTGIGIAPEALERVFSVFEQADTSTTRRFGGTGLGLAISRRLVEQMDGRLAVTSTPGAGSCFSIHLQFASGAPVPTAEAVITRAYGARVLLAEDNPVNQMLARRLLEQLGLEVTLVGDGAAAVEACTGQPFDLVCMDLQMPVMGGVEATRALAASHGDALPVIALSADVAGLADPAVAALFAAVVAKPVRKPGLVAALDSVLGERSAAA